MSRDQSTSPAAHGVTGSYRNPTAVIRVLDVTAESATTPTVDVPWPTFLCPRLTTAHGSAFSAIKKCKQSLHALVITSAKEVMFSSD